MEADRTWGRARGMTCNNRTGDSCNHKATQHAHYPLGYQGCWYLLTLNSFDSNDSLAHPPYLSNIALHCNFEVQTACIQPDIHQNLKNRLNFVLGWAHRLNTTEKKYSFFFSKVSESCVSATDVSKYNHGHKQL